ncbi:MAG: DOMON-like domain-containing protein [Pseudomonadota bacterium]
MSTELTHLECHPIMPCAWVDALTVSWTRSQQGFTITYRLSGDLSELVWPAQDGGQRRDELWKTTCFEAFFRAQDSEHYVEFNFAPNGDWAAYRFSGYRSNQTQLTCSPPVIESSFDKNTAIVQVTLPEGFPEHVGGPILFGPTGILEAADGTHSFWALHHALIKPDFHHIETFKMTLD